MYIVSIPYRYSKNAIKSSKVAPFSRVSIPYRYSKNTWISLEPVIIPEVSIPYRYSKNISEQEFEGMPDEFQFLIGILKTNSKEYKRRGRKWFQFLIGILKTLC